MDLNYSFAVLKYRHDASAGEILNVGVVLFAPDVGRIGLRYDPRYSRLSEAFAGFDGDLYRSVLGRLQAALCLLAAPMGEGLFQLAERERYSDVGAILRSAWPDQGLSYFASAPLFGTGFDFEDELDDVYGRLVLSQRVAVERQARFSDEEVWSEFRRAPAARRIAGVLRSKSFGPAEVEFQYAFKNERWHVIEPVSLDYSSPSDMKQRALLTFGKAAAVKGYEEFGKFYVIVGRPRRTEVEKKYHEAMTLLRDLPVPHEVVEESEADHFADRLEAELIEHGVLHLEGPPLELAPPPPELKGRE